MRKRIMAMLLALVMVVGVLPVAALAEEPVSDTEPTTVPTETTAPTEATAPAEAVQADVSQYALTDGISTYDAFNCDVVLIPDSINAKPTGFKVKLGDMVNGYKVISLNSRTYEVLIDIGVFQSESALPKFRIPLPEEIWTGVKATDSTYVLCVKHWKPGDTMKLGRGNQMRYYSMGTEWYFSLNYDANGGSRAPAAQTYTTNTASETSYTFTIPKNVPTRKGYTFQGWSFEKNGTASYQPGQTCTLTRPKDGAITSTLYAVWEEAVPSKPQWSDIRGEMQKVSVHVTCSNPDVNHTEKTYSYKESNDDTIGSVQGNAGSYTCTVTVHLGRYRLKYNQDFPREHEFVSSLTADVVLQYNGTDWKIISDPTLELKLTCGSMPTPDPPGQDVLNGLKVLVDCDAKMYHYAKTYEMSDGDYRLEKVDDNTYTVTVTADKYVEKYNNDYPRHTLFDNNTKTIKLVHRYGEWTEVGSNSVTFNVSCEQKYTVTYTDGVDGEVIFNDQVYYKKLGEKTPAFRGTTPTRTGYKFIRWEPAVAANVTGNATYTAVWEEAAPQVTKPTKEFLIKEFKIATVKCTTEGSGHGEQSYPLTESSISIGDPVDDGTYYYCLVTVTSAPYVDMFDTATGSTHTAGAATDQQTAYCFDGQNWFVSHSIDGPVLFPIVFKVTCDTEPEIPDPASGAFDNWNIQLDCVTDDSHDQQLRYSDGTYRFERDDDPQYGRLVFDAASYLAKYNEIFKGDHGNHGLNDATAAVTLELAYKDGQWQPKVPNALPTIQVTCANEPEAPEKPGLDDLKGKIIGIVTVQCVTAPEAHSNQLYSLNENAYDVTGPTLENGQYTCVVTVKAGYYLDSYNTGAFAGPHTISGDTSKKVKLIWDNQNEKWAAADGQKHNIVFNVQCETHTVTYTDGVDGVEVFKDVVHENLPYGTKTPAFYTKDLFRKGYVFTGWNPAVADKVTGNQTYTATWKVDANGNGIPDDKEDKYTVTYTDGVENEEIFADQNHAGLLSGTATPAFNGTPTRTGYVFSAWNPAVTGTVTGNVTYTAVWEEDANGNGTPDKDEEKYTVTYTDGVENKEIFADQVYGNLLSGTAMPAFNGTPTRTGYVFGGWNPAVAAKVTGNQTYTATWKVDANGNGIADDKEDKFTVTYTDGADGKAFTDQVYGNLLSGVATPAFNGTPKRDGYVFDGWNPAVADKVTESKTYTAAWKVDANGNGIADDLEDKYTVTYTDGVKGKAFADQVYDNLLSGTATPAFNGTPTRTGYVFGGWNPAVAAKVTESKIYSATWKPDTNGNGIADDNEDKYTVTYTDGVKGKAFADQVYDNLLSGTDTPAFNGKPTRKGYTFVSWTPKVTDTVTKTVTYTATWKANSGKDNVPKTGDSGIVPVLGSVLLFSFCGAAACVFDRKRKHI